MRLRFSELSRIHSELLEGVVRLPTVALKIAPLWLCAGVFFG